VGNNICNACGASSLLGCGFLFFFFCFFCFVFFCLFFEMRAEWGEATACGMCGAVRLGDAAARPRRRLGRVGRR
jgi:hypothetical protein